MDHFYQCVFAGSYATYYWQNTSWYQIISNPLSLPEENQPSYQYYTYLSDFFKKYDYYELRPAQFEFSPYCLTNFNDLFIYYVPENLHRVTGNSEALAGKTIQLTWFNPYTGTYTPGIKQLWKHKWQEFQRPETIGMDNVILIVEII